VSLQLVAKTSWKPATPRGGQFPDIASLVVLKRTELPYRYLCLKRLNQFLFVRKCDSVAAKPNPAGYSGEGEHRFRREGERHSGVKVNSSRSEATLA
jgi:hypothetical protein